MDYGKLAYMKVEDLENRIITETKNPYQSTSSFSAPDCPLPSSGIEIGTFVSDGSATIIVRAEVSKVREGGAKFEVKTDLGMSVVTKIFMSAGVEILMGSVKAKSGVLTAFLSGGAVLKSVTLAFMGGGAYLSRLGDDYRAISTTEGEQVLFTKDSRIFCAAPSPSSVHGEFKVSHELGIGQKLDACSVKTGFCAVYCDFYDNIWGLNKSGILDKRFIVFNRAVRGLALADCGAGLLLAILNKDKTVSVYLCDYNFGSKREIECGLVADRISFLSSVSPVMVVEKDGEAELRFFENDGSPSVVGEIEATFEYRIIN